jgi:hypothetical protein
MNESEISQYITETFEGVDVMVASGDSFFFYNPDRSVPPDHRFMFATIVTSDINDQFSDLNRPSVFRVNIGISKQTFRSFFSEPSLPSDQNSTVKNRDTSNSDYDFTALNQVMPHPVYGRMYWTCILSPGDETFKTTVQPLIAEAYGIAVSKYRRLATRS